MEVLGQCRKLDCFGRLTPLGPISFDGREILGIGLEVVKNTASLLVLKLVFLSRYTCTNLLTFDVHMKGEEVIGAVNSS